MNIASFTVQFIKRILSWTDLELNYLGFEAEMQTRLTSIPSNPVDVYNLRDVIYSSPNMGVLHIGAHRGQEAERYAKAGARVLWIEANPKIFEELNRNISLFPKQSAVNALLGDAEKEVPWHIASNAGESSSVFEFAEDNSFQVTTTHSTTMQMQRLDSLFTVEEVIDYPHWVIDVQGAELLVLAGAGRLMDVCMSVDVEVSTRNVYEGAPEFEELDAFLLAQGFVPLWKPKENSHEDLIYVRVQTAPSTHRR